MRTWDDNTAPIAYLITFRTYGTWLHGDARGSVDRLVNEFGTGYIPERPERLAYNESLMKQRPVILNGPQRSDVEAAIRAVCDHREWALRAVHVRTNHAHVVTGTGDRRPETPLNAFKAYATRRMRANGNWTSDRSPWADKGSCRWLWYDEAVYYACDYVRNRQGGDLADFDAWMARNDMGGPTR